MKKIISAFVLAVLATSQAQAISISRGGGSTSKSMGMSRPAITQQAAPRPSAPATAYRPAQPAAIAPAYRTHDDVDNVEINEVWHFVLQGRRWLLNGIEQIQA